MKKLVKTEILVFGQVLARVSGLWRTQPTHSELAFLPETLQVTLANYSKQNLSCLLKAKINHAYLANALAEQLDIVFGGISMPPLLLERCHDALD